MPKLMVKKKVLWFHKTCQSQIFNIISDMMIAIYCNARLRMCNLISNRTSKTCWVSRLINLIGQYEWKESQLPLELPNQLAMRIVFTFFDTRSDTENGAIYTCIHTPTSKELSRSLFLNGFGGTDKVKD